MAEGLTKSGRRQGQKARNGGIAAEPLLKLSDDLTLEERQELSPMIVRAEAENDDSLKVTWQLHHLPTSRSPFISSTCQSFLGESG